MIPEFPKFKSLELSDRAEVEKITRLFPPYSDFNFTSLWCWDVEGKTRLSKLNGNLVVRFTDYLSGELFYTFLGNRKVTETTLTLLERAKVEGLTCQLRLIPEIVVKSLEKKFVRIKEDRGNFDYVNSLGGLNDFQGKKWHSKRNLVNRFRKRKNTKTNFLSITDPETQKKIIRVSKIPTKDEGSERGGNLNEMRAITRLFSLAKQKNIAQSLVSIGIFHDAQLIAFNVSETVQHNYAIVHFEKANFALYPEVGAHIYLEVIKELSSRNVRSVNIEQDLNIPGLRANKMSYHPTEFLKKYTIFPND